MRVRQGKIKKLQRRIARERAELAVHRDHLTDMREDLDAVLRRVQRAIRKLDEVQEGLP